MAFMDSFFNNAQVIFGGFHKPEVLKSNDDGLQRQISYLEAHLTEENKRKLAGLKKGLEGEQNVLFQLKTLELACISCTAYMLATWMAMMLKLILLSLLEVGRIS